MAPNVLLIVLDTARADAFEPYGAPAGSSPTVAQIAREGRAVEDFFSTACWTLPSHASMFTGLMPRALGLSQAPGGVPQGARPVLEGHRDRLLPEVLRRAGYSTRGVSANLWIADYSGFATGFDDFEVVLGSSRQSEVARSDLRGRLVWALDGVRADADDGAGEVESIIGRWLGEERQQPFFWFVNLVECHSPYLPPKPYNDLSALGRLRAADEARRHLSLEAIWRTCLGEFDVPEGALERMRHLYARSVRMEDDWLARVLAALDERGVLDETLVIVTSDHGENLGEGGLLAHAFSLDDRLIRVPFVVNRPDFVEGAGAHSLARLPAMLARYLGIENHPWADGSLPSSAAPAQFDFVGEEDPRVEVGLQQWNLGAKGRAMMTTSLTCVTDGRLKLMARGDTEELYDLEADPLETNPRSAPDEGRTQALRAELHHPALWAEGDSNVPAELGEVEELESRMRLLGYM